MQSAESDEQPEKERFDIFIITYSRMDMHIFINYVDLCSLKMAPTYRATLPDTAFRFQ
jgi:hypothetical protein